MNVRESSHTVVLWPKRYYDSDTGKFDLDRMETIFSQSINQLWNCRSYSDHSFDDYRPTRNQRRPEAWFEPKDNDWDEEIKREEQQKRAKEAKDAKEAEAARRAREREREAERYAERERKIAAAEKAVADQAEMARKSLEELNLLPKMGEFTADDLDSRYWLEVGTRFGWKRPL